MGIVLMVAHTAACTTTVAINSHNIHLLPIRSACMMTKDYLLFWMCLVTPSFNLQFMHVCDDVKLCVPNARRISSRAWSPPVPSDTSLSSKRKQVPSWCLGCRFFNFGDTLSSMQASAKLFTLRNPSMLRQVSHVSQILPGITFNIGRGTHMC